MCPPLTALSTAKRADSSVIASQLQLTTRGGLNERDMKYRASLEAQDVPARLLLSRGAFPETSPPLGVKVPSGANGGCTATGRIIARNLSWNRLHVVGAHMYSAVQAERVSHAGAWHRLKTASGPSRLSAGSRARVLQSHH